MEKTSKLYKIARLHITPFVRGIFGRTIILGKEKIEKGKALIIASNHISMRDPAYIMKLTDRDINFMSKAELFKYKIVAKLLTSLNAFPVDRENPSPATLMHTVRILRKKGALGIFPEGTVNKTLGPIKEGVGAIAEVSKADVAVVVMKQCILHRKVLVQDYFSSKGLKKEEINERIKTGFEEGIKILSKKKNCPQ